MTKKPAKKEVKLNLGSGVQLLPGFINIDIVKPPNATKDNFLQGDVRNIPVPSGTVDYILMDNVLEHLPQKDIPSVLYEIRRVLKIGGRAVIQVPELGFIARQWIAMEEGGFNPINYHWVAETIYGNQNHPGEFHQAAISPAYFNYVLKMAGFIKFELIVHPAGGPLPKYPGMGQMKGAYIRNDQLVADIIKT